MRSRTAIDPVEQIYRATSEGYDLNVKCSFTLHAGRIAEGVACEQRELRSLLAGHAKDGLRADLAFGFQDPPVVNSERETESL